MKQVAQVVDMGEEGKKRVVRSPNKSGYVIDNRDGRNGGGRKPGVPNKNTAEIKALAQVEGPASIAKLAWLRDHGETQTIMGFAAEKLLDRGYGKCVQMVAGDRDSDPIRLETSMTDVAKLLLLKIGGE